MNLLQEVYPRAEAKQLLSDLVLQTPAVYFFFQSYIRNYSSVPLFLMSKLELWLRFGGALHKK